jgi:hypothetical protein
MLSVSNCQKQTIKQNNQEQHLKFLIEAEKKRVVTLKNEGEALKQKLYKDSVKQKSVVIALESKIKVLTKEVKRSREIAQPEIDSSPTLTKFAIDVDSLDIAQIATIDTLSAQNARNWRSFNNILSVQEEKYKVQVELNEHYQDLNKQVSKQLKRESRKKTVWKIATGIIGTVLLFEVIKN